MLPQRVPDLDKKFKQPLTPPFLCVYVCVWDSQWLIGHLPLGPHMKRLVIYCGPR